MKEEAVFSTWNQSDGLIHHRKLQHDLRVAIKEALKHFTVTEIQQAIANYSLVMTDDIYFWTYRWTLAEFLSRRDGRKASDQYKWWQFLQNNFREAKYLIKTEKANLKLFPIGGNCCKCKMPAVYKNTQGDYDSKYCKDHMPEEVKELYA